MLKKDYVLGYINDKLGKGIKEYDISEKLGISYMTVLLISMMRESGEPLQTGMTNLDMIGMYQDGLTFSEISKLKGVTDVAIRLSITSMLGVNKEITKRMSRDNRYRIRDIILYDELVLEAEQTSKEDAYKKSGYSRGVFNRVYREALDWKERQEEEQQLQDTLDTLDTLEVMDLQEITATIQQIKEEKRVGD